MSEKQTLRQKLHSVYSEIEVVLKGGRHSQYDYVRAVDVVNKVRGVLKKINVYAEVHMSFIRGYEYKTAKGSVMNAADVECVVNLLDLDGDPEIRSGKGLGSAADAGDKYLYKAQTGALKYALRNAFLIPDENDPEADETVDETPELPRKSTKQTLPQTREESVSGEKPETLRANSSEVPAGADLDAFRNTFRQLVDDLATAGLKASSTPKMSHAQKVLEYLKKTTGATDATQITQTQWKTFFDVVRGVKQSDGGIKELVKLIEKAAKPQKEEEAEA